MKIEIELSEKNEGTYAPFWHIIDPQRLKNVARIAKKHAEISQYSCVFFNSKNWQKFTEDK